MTSSRCILARDAGIPCYSVRGCGIPHHKKGGIREPGIGGYKSKCLRIPSPNSMTTLGQHSFSVVDSVGPTLETNAGPT